MRKGFFLKWILFPINFMMNGLILINKNIIPNNKSIIMNYDKNNKSSKLKLK